MAQMIANAISRPARTSSSRSRFFSRAIVTTLAIILVGWLIAMLLRTVVRSLLGWVRINSAAERFGVAPLLRTADLAAGRCPAGSHRVLARLARLPAVGHRRARLHLAAGPGGELLGIRAAADGRRGDPGDRIRRGELRLARHAAGGCQRARAVAPASRAAPCAG